MSAHVLQKLMRHANIKTTTDYYANVDNAVMEAILGPGGAKRNGSRNVGQGRGGAEPRKTDASPCGEEG